MIDWKHYQETFLSVVSETIYEGKNNFFSEKICKPLVNLHPFIVMSTPYTLRKLQNNISYTSQKTTIINESFLGNICFGIEENQIDNIKYKISNCEYLEEDFSLIDFNKYNINKDKTVVFFDDHQAGYRRLIEAQQAGFTHIMYDDNYPWPGDNYSLKQTSKK